MEGRKMKKRTITGLILALVLTITGIAIAQPGGGMGDRMNGSMGNRQMEGQRNGNQEHGNFFRSILPLLHAAELTDQQRESVAEIIEDAKAEIESLDRPEDPGSRREQFIDLFSSSSLTVAQMESLIGPKIENIEATNRIVSQALVDIHDLLTDEQLEKLASFDPESMERRDGSGRPRGGNDGRMDMGVHPNR